ncbi:MAG: cytochrome c maturation protein CcmE [Gammaproteobacteria bacterium]|jgi:cytochrome c-type biogenesis protein CcmE
MKPRRQRMLAVGLIVAGIAIALALILRALDSNIMLFLSPSEVVAGAAPAERPFRLGGHVVAGSFQRAEGSLTSTFLVTDNQQTVQVSYTGVLPDLFKEGQATVAKGRLGSDGVFIADEVLAKHDENYMPPEVAKMLEEQGAHQNQPDQQTTQNVAGN